MNRVKYKFHPSSYELGENEKFYSDMEAKGWRLVKRGGWRSKFIPVEPSQVRYRVEVSSSGYWEVDGPSEGQLAVFEDCGWEYVSSRGFLYIFRAPEGSEAPEFYADPVQQAQTLKKLRRDLWIILGIWIALLALWVNTPSLTGQPPSRYLGSELLLFVQRPALYLLRYFFLLWAFCETVWSAWRIARIYRRLKKGIPLDHTPKVSRTLRILLYCSLLLVTGLSLILLAVQEISTRTEELPGTADGPYLLVSGLGWEGERTNSGEWNDSEITYTPSLLADYWDTVEYIRTSEGELVWMRQDVYRLRFPGMAGAVAQALMDIAVFQEEFFPVEADGLDAAWTTGRFEVVAVKGNMVAYVDGLGAADGDFDPQAVCTALAALWGD